MIARMFDDVGVAVVAFRAAYRAHHAARAVVDFDGMVAAADRIREVTDYLRSQHRAELIFPLTMEWATEGRDPVEHARYRDEVDKLLAE